MNQPDPRHPRPNYPQIAAKLCRFGVHPKFQGCQVTVTGQQVGWFAQIGRCPVTVTFSPGTWDTPIGFQQVGKVADFVYNNRCLQAKPSINHYQ